MEKINYNPVLFDILKNLTTISNSVIIKKENDLITIRRVDSEFTIAYSLKAPLDYFDFPSTNDDVTFYNYTEFYQYLKSFNLPDIFIDNMKITLKENNSKIDYILSNPESFEKKTPKEPVFGEPDVSFNFSAKDHEEFIKMITLIKPKKAKLTYNDDNKINIVLFNDLHDNIFEKTFEVTSARPDAAVDFMIFSDTFLQIPPRRDYSISIKDDSFVKISLLNNNMNLDIFTSKIKTNK